MMPGVLLIACLFAQTPVASPVATAWSIGKHLSPDGHYAADLKMGEAEVVELSITNVTTGRKRIFVERDCTGCIWDPRSDARLIFSTDGLYGKARVAVWQPVIGAKAVVTTRHPSDWSYRLKSFDSEKGEIRYDQKKAEEDVAAYRPASTRIPSR